MNGSTAPQQPPQKPVPQLKDPKVHIKSTNTVPIRTKVAGDLTLLVLGLGDDDNMYSYNAKTKQWFDRI